ncbi:GCN5-related N-acetyltransferase 4, chloroplastic isoform X3 [Lycium barbarum]|uniref:GCN5-related N-acetyltransferase 4, chloroplastic isoform X3 n=1 Tax=Lycium barbarum TaxID=112863 RepID=UPI00293F1047|nr:GCN5-related N-acetyltransferase 4, chloroplastic isoform X3 [Lycium barbarum]
MWTVPLGGTTCVIDNSLNLGINKIPFPFKASPKSLPTSGLCRASQVAELFPTISPEVYVREARVEDCWEVAETHCSSFFPEYSFPLDFVLRIDRLIAMLFGFSIPIGCQRTCLVAVVGSRDEEACLFGGFDGRLSLNKGYVTGVLTVDTVADFLPRKGPLRQRRNKGSQTSKETKKVFYKRISTIGQQVQVIIRLNAKGTDVHFGDPPA